MFVRFLIGPRKGEIAEMNFIDARPLLDDGRASLAYAENTPEPPPARQPQPKAKEAKK